MDTTVHMECTDHRTSNSLLKIELSGNSHSGFKKNVREGIGQEITFFFYFNPQGLNIASQKTCRNRGRVKDKRIGDKRAGFYGGGRGYV